MPTKVLNSDFYLISPLIITDWTVFEPNTTQRMWTENSKFRSYSIKPLLASFLGAAQANEFPIANGLHFQGEIQNCGDSFFVSLKDEKVFFTDKKDRHLPDIGNPFDFPSTVQLYVSPNHRCALYVIKLTNSSVSSLEEAENAAYVLHKTDHKQIPYIYSADGTSKKTLKELIEVTLPHGGFEWESDSRFISATYARVDASSVDYKVSDVNTALIRLSLCKDRNYKIPKDEFTRILPVYDNILTSSSREGFASIAISKDPENEIPFINDFGATFEQSYLPLYLATTLVDQVYVSTIKNLEQVAKSAKEQDYLREARLVLVIPPSPYEHLNKQMERLLQGRNLSEKYDTIRDSILSRKEQIEYERLQIEKENQRIALENKELEEKERQERLEAEERRKEEEERERKRVEEIRDARDRRINFLLGFIGIGQVVFAILQLLGANNVMGICVADSSGLKITSIVMLSIFTALIVYLLVRLFAEKRRKNN